MGPAVEPVPVGDAVPERADVAIVGGGIIGVSTALFLAREGLSVVLCEKGHVAGEQSSRNWGWCRRMGRDPRELPLIVEALKLWPEMERLTGEDVGFRRSGILYLCDDERDVARREVWLKRAGDHVLDTRMIQGAELAALLPGATRAFKAALYTPSDGRAEPQKAAPAIARAAQRAGAAILQNCAVRAISTAGGRIDGVETERGTIRAATVVLAGGAWSSRLCGPLGLRLPQLGVRASVLRTSPVDGPEGAAWANGFAYRKRLDGGYTIADGTTNHHHIVPDSFRFLADFLPILALEWRHVGVRLGGDFLDGPAGVLPGRSAVPSRYERYRTLDPQPATKLLDHALDRMRAVFPALRQAEVVQRWAGIIDATPDAVPVISTVETVPGLVIATGFSGHGFGIGPGAGRLAADLALGKAPLVDPSAFRFSRFGDGTPMRPTTGL